MQEEIIIDGVNVVGCPDIKQYNDTEGNMMCMEYIDGSCEGHNCFFKQLKRLEQENKDLKKQIESDKGLITVGGKQQYQYLQRIDELEQENKKLRYKIQEVVQANDRIVAECAEIMKPKCETSMISELMKENKELKEEIRFHNKENSNLLAERNAAQIGYDEIREIREGYRSALEEIRQIAEKYKDMEGCRIPLGAIKMTVDEVLNS